MVNAPAIGNDINASPVANDFGRAALRPGRSRTPRRSALVYLAFLVPGAALLMGLMLFPLIMAVSTSLRDAGSATDVNAPFVGLDNYRRFFEDPLAWLLIRNSYIRAIGGVVPSYVLGLLAALALSTAIRGKKYLRLAVLLPFVITAPAALAMWKIVLDPYTGVPAAIGLQVGDIFTNPDWVWPALLSINAWASFQFYTIILTAGLTRIPTELYEASAVDGAGRWRQFLHITMPGIAGISLAACGFHFLESFMEFNLVYIMTGGGPLNQTQTMATYSYVQAFSNNDMGFATALTLISSVLVAASLGMFVTTVWAIRRWSAHAQRRRAIAMATAVAGATVPSPEAVATHRPRGRSRRPRPGAARLVNYLWVGVFVLLSLAPILFILSRSLDGSPGGSQAVTLIPREPTLDNYIDVLTRPTLWSAEGIAEPPLVINFINSALVSVATMIIVVVAGMLAGYSISRWRTFASRGMVGALVLFQLAPAIVLVFPLYQLLARVGLLNSRPGLVLATSAFFLAISTLLFKIFFDGVPRELEEAAMLDGAGPARTLWSIMRPMAAPAVGAVAAYTLVNAWNEFLLATTLIIDMRFRTLPPALKQFTSSFTYQAEVSPGEQAVYLLIPIFAALILLAATQRHLVTAYSGAVKG